MSSMYHCILRGPCRMIALAAICLGLTALPVQADESVTGTAADTADNARGADTAGSSVSKPVDEHDTAAAIPTDSGAAGRMTSQAASDAVATGAAAAPMKAAAEAGRTKPDGRNESAAAGQDPASADRTAATDGAAVDVTRLWPPVDSLVTSPFGERRGPLVGRAGRRHSGLDIRAHIGWPVRSLGDGVVQRAGPGGVAGIMVQVRQDNGRLVSYAHLQKALVKQGQHVNRGQYVGRVGCTGRTTGAHLHISVRGADGRLIDPRQEFTGLWELFDPPLADLEKPIEAMFCPMSERIRGSVNRRLIGQQHYLRLQRLSKHGNFKVPDLP